MEEGDSSLSQSLDIHASLLRAALTDDWKAAKAFIHENHPIKCLEAPITEEKGTALHIAAAAKHTRFVKELVKKMTSEELKKETKTDKCTALFFAAQSGIVTIAEVMVNKNKDLPSIFPKDHIEFLPLYAAIKTGNRDMVSYLYSVTPIQDLASKDRIELLNATISADLYDTALKILDTLKSRPAKDQKTLDPEEKKLLWHSLEMLARKPSEIGSKSQPSLWERCLNSSFRGRLCYKAMMQASAHQLVDRLWKEFGDDNFSSILVRYKMQRCLVEAAKVGNVEFLIILLRSYPHLVWKLQEEICVTLLHYAIKHRQERVFNIIHEIGVLKGNLASFYAKEGNNMLRLVGELPSSDRLNIVSGAALQMQRELLWFQEIEKIVPKSSENKTSIEEKIVPKSSHKPVNEITNRQEEQTPSWARDKFMKNHEGLQQNGEKWMKDTANSCMLVAALIATVVFPAAFTVPGGNNQETGIPIFLESSWFTVFLISDAIAMLFSSSSILVFLTILTSRYTAKDFIKSLPRRLVLGLFTLFISIVGMLIAFTAACFLVFKSKTSVPVRIIVAAPAVPISLFVILHYGLWFDILRSAFCTKSLLSGDRISFSSCELQASKEKNDNQSCNFSI